MSTIPVLVAMRIANNRTDVSTEHRDRAVDVSACQPLCAAAARAVERSLMAYEAVPGVGADSTVIRCGPVDHDSADARSGGHHDTRTLRAFGRGSGSVVLKARAVAGGAVSTVAPCAKSCVRTYYRWA